MKAQSSGREGGREGCGQAHHRRLLNVTLSRESAAEYENDTFKNSNIELGDGKK